MYEKASTVCCFTHVSSHSCSFFPCRKQKTNDPLQFTAQCGTYVTVFLINGKFNNEKGPLVMLHVQCGICMQMA